MRFEIWAFRTRNGIDYRIATEIKRSGSVFFGYLTTKTKKEAIEKLLLAIGNAVNDICDK